jgi:hypothetical protein
MQLQFSKNWIKILLLNISIVAILGILMRYKIGFEFPYFDQKNLQNAHSHFAFSGWVTQAFFYLLVSFISPALKSKEIKKYHLLLNLNLLCAYLMLLSFSVQGYGAISITISTTSLLIFFTFAFNYIKDLKKIPFQESTKWFKAALLFGMVSSIGTLSLSVMMATKNLEQHLYLASIYWYLHFQYNGWFFFMIMGLSWVYLQKKLQNILIPSIIFKLLFWSCFLNYGLSILWLQMPILAYIVIVIAVTMQSVAAFLFFKLIIKEHFFSSISNKLLKYLFAFVGVALLIKFSLQLFSIIPSISKLVFGFRPIVIAYLHLVLLAITSVFIITYLFANHFIINNTKAKKAIVLFTIGVLLNEFILGVQGIASISYIVVPYTNYMLLAVSVLILVSSLMLIISQYQKEQVTQNQ